MPVVTEAYLNDLVISTNPNQDKRKYYLMAQAMTQYHVMPIWFRKDKVGISSGWSIQKTLMTAFALVKTVGMDALDESNVLDQLRRMDVPWRRKTANWTYCIDEELMNKEPSKIVNEFDAKRDSIRLGFAEDLEKSGFKTPLTADDEETWWGVPYWVTKSNTQGFNGGALFGSTKAGVDPTKVRHAKNWTDQYAALTEDDFIAKARQAMYRTGFKSPIGVDQFRGPMGRRFKLYAEYSVIAALETEAKNQNESLGFDIGATDGVTTFRKNGLYPVDELENDTDDPFYGIDHDAFVPAVLNGAFMRESSPKEVPYQHTWKSVHTDLVGNFVCTQPSRCFVLKK